MGNSAGVVLPKEWLHGKAKVTLIERPVDIKKELLEILDEYMGSIIGIALVGSYARGEQTPESDIDVLVITQDIAQKIKHGKYEILMVPLDALRKHLKRNAVPLIPMLREAKPLINRAVFDDYRKEKITRENLEPHIETTKSVLAVVHEFLALYESKERISDAILYSLVLRLREWHIVENILRRESVKKGEFIALVKHVSGSYDPYRAYLRSKNEKKDEKKTSVEAALKIYNHLSEKIKEQEAWIRKRE